MQLEKDYLDFLQNIEATVLDLAKSNETIKDADVIKAYDRLVKYYQRKKQHLPETESTLSGNAALIFQACRSVCEWRRKKGPLEKIEMDEQDGLGNNVPIAVVIRCLEKLHKSAENWNKLNGQKGYLNCIAQFL